MCVVCCVCVCFRLVANCRHVSLNRVWYTVYVGLAAALLSWRYSLSIAFVILNLVCVPLDLLRPRDASSLFVSSGFPVRETVI